MPQSIADILSVAADRGRGLGLSYAGALTPPEAHQFLRHDRRAVLVDVRTAPERAFVGGVEDSVLIEWQYYPDMTMNGNFAEELRRAAAAENAVLFLCRSGVRSHYAAVVAEQAGYLRAFNVLEGFEGDRDENGRRGRVNGWRFHGLPWSQS